MDRPSSPPPGVYSHSEADAIVSFLHAAKDGPALWKFFRQEGHRVLFDPSCASESLLFGYVFALFSTRQYEEMFKIIRECRFYKRDYSELQDYWFEGHYRQYEEEKRKSLTALLKFRMRQKNPLPPSISEGELKYGKKQWELVKAYNEAERTYPTLCVIQELSARTGLAVSQIQNWFKNRRNRERRKQQDNFLHNYYNIEASTSAVFKENLLLLPKD